MIATRICILVTFIIGCEAGLRLQVSPDHIQTCAVKSHETLNCTFEPTDVSLQLVSLSIYKIHNDSASEDLTSIDAFSDGVIHKNGSLIAMSTGQINQHGHSFLTLDYPNPDAGDAGTFQCEAHTVDYHGHPKVFTSDVKVEVLTPSPPTAPPSSGDLPLTPSQIAQLKELQFLYEKEHNKPDGFYDNLSFITSQGFNGHKYLISTVSQPYEVDWLQCAQQGGYLVEINTKEEHEFIKSFLFKQASQISQSVTVLTTGAIDNGTDFVFLKHPKDSAYVDINPIITGYDKDKYYCVSLSRNYGWDFMPSICESHDVSSICEVPDA